MKGGSIGCTGILIGKVVFFAYDTPAFATSNVNVNIDKEIIASHNHGNGRHL